MIQELSLSLAIFLVLVLGTAGVHKVLEPARLASAAARLLGVAPRFGLPLSLCAAIVELAAAVLLLVPATRQVGALAAASLCALYSILLFRARGGAVFDCGCVFGSQATASSRASAFRALAIAAMAVLVAVPPGSKPMGILDILAALGFFSLYLAVSEIVTVSGTQGRATA